MSEQEQQQPQVEDLYILCEIFAQKPELLRDGEFLLELYRECIYDADDPISFDEFIQTIRLVAAEFDTFCKENEEVLATSQNEQE